MYKVCVYAICKNEIAFVRRWMDSMREADWVCVLDTGSTDGTPELLTKLGARVEKRRIEPWRFDSARNASMKLIPAEADLCVCTDLDEVFEPGWRQALERDWTPDATQARYRFTWSFKPDGSEGVVFWPEKIHKNGDFQWTHPVHEVLHYTGSKPAKLITCANVQLNHLPDLSKPRSQYLPLLELSVAEDPEDDRNTHYLGREYLYYGRWEECIAMLKRHLALQRATWADERCASMRFIAQAEESLGHLEAAESWLFRAIAEAPYLREPWVETALFLYRAEDWLGTAYMIKRALAIKDRPASYITTAEAWDATPWDIAAIAYYRLGDYAESERMAEEALARSPEDERLRENLRLIRAKTHTE